MEGEFKIRSAHPMEEISIITMMRALHAELEPLGGRVRIGTKTEEWYRSLFAAATSGAGICLVAANGSGLVGYSLAVEEDLPYDHDWENPVFGFGTYVKPEYRKLGLAEHLYKEMMAETKRRNQTYIGAYLPENKPIQRVLKRLGTTEIETLIIFPRE